MVNPLYVIPGHGHGDPGAGGGGQTEADNVRKLATRIKELAVNPNDVILHPFDRNAYAQGDLNTWSFPAGAQVIELHMDSGGGAARGAHVIIKDGFSPDAFDQKLAKSLSTILPGRSDIVVKRSNLANVNRAARRGINYRLAECGFIDNATDRQIFNSRLDDIARAILDAAGIPAKGTSTRGGWKQDAKGWWYEHSDGSYAKGGWEKINGRWYAFNDAGYMFTGWYNPARGEWYWLGSDGAARFGWELIGGKWYYFAPQAGAGYKQCQMYADAWVGDGKGKEYYLTGDGSMATGCWVDHARYYVDSDGIWDKNL